MEVLFTEKSDSGYTVVPPTAGVVVENLPEGGEEVRIGDVTYVKIGEVYYQPHLTHGAAVNISGKLWRFVHYGVRKDNELIDMDEVRRVALAERPRVIVAGFTAYPRQLDFAAFRTIADECGAYLMVDMAHFAGLVAAKVHPDPVPHCDFVTATTHKTLRGPRGGLIMCREEHRRLVDSAVFPGVQGGPLVHVIAGKAVAFHEALSPGFQRYQEQIIANARALAEELLAHGFRLVTGGTDNQ